MRQSGMAWGVAALLSVCGVAAAADRVVDGFDLGVTQQRATTHGFGSTAAPGINAADGNGDQVRYFSWATVAGAVVSLDNVGVPGVLQLRHAGGDEFSYMNVSYGFTTPTDVSRFAALQVSGSGSGRGNLVLALQDRDGDVMLRSFALAGTVGDLVAPLASMQCQGSGGGACQLDQVVGLEFYAGGFAGSPFAYDLDQICFVESVATAGGGSGAVTSPIPEPQTWALMGLGLAAVGWAARRRRVRS